MANGRSTEEIQEIIGADRLIYLDLHGLIRSVRHDNSDIREFDTSCFSGEYVTGDVTKEYLLELAQERNDHAKDLRNASLHELAGLDIIQDDEQEAGAGGDEESMSDPGTAVGM